MKKGHWLLAVVVFIALGLAGWNSRAQTSPRINWEYKVITGNHHALGLTELGDQGWELIAIERTDSTRALINNYYFKRPK